MGNFPRGVGSLEGVWRHPDTDSVVIVAGGMVYIVDPVKRRPEQHFASDISATLEIQEFNGLVFTNGLWFEAIGAEGPICKSRRLSWDGVRDLQHSQSTLRGEAHNTMTDKWLEFELDLLTGEVWGGSYDGPPM